jgi:hypothetical protein
VTDADVRIGDEGDRDTAWKLEQRRDDVVGGPFDGVALRLPRLEAAHGRRILSV